MLCCLSQWSWAQCDCDPCSPSVPISEAEETIIYINVNSDGNADCSLATNPVQNFMADFNHSYLGDIKMTLTSPMGQSVFLIGGSDYFGDTDDGTDGIDRFIPTFVPNAVMALQGVFESKTVSQKTKRDAIDNITGDFHPFSSDLGQFSGSLCGQWQLRISDSFNEDQGQLNDLMLNFTSQVGIECNTTQTALAAELIEFRAFAQQEVNVLEWLTATESDTEWHIIERSENGLDFKEIAREKAQGNTASATAYRFVDAKPLFKSYYRIRTVDFNGHQEFSHVVTVNRDLPEVFILNKLYPSPTVDVVNIEYTLPTAATVVTRLLDINGKLLNTNELPAQSGLNTLQLDMNNYTAGFYFLVMEADGTRIVKRVVKQ